MLTKACELLKCGTLESHMYTTIEITVSKRTRTTQNEFDLALSILQNNSDYTEGRIVVVDPATHEEEVIAETYYDIDDDANHHLYTWYNKKWLNGNNIKY